MALAVSPCVVEGCPVSRFPRQALREQGVMQRLPVCKRTILPHFLLWHLEIRGLLHRRGTGSARNGHRPTIVCTLTQAPEIARVAPVIIPNHAPSAQEPIPVQTSAPKPSATHPKQRRQTSWGKTHSLTQEGAAVVASLTDWMEAEIVPMLKDPSTNWQPADFLPDPSAEDFLARVADLRARSAGVPDDVMVCLVGDMVSEEALPTYLTMLNTLDVTRDESGASVTPWAIWGRGWAAEENRHGDALQQYLYLTGRVNMRAVQRTTQYLIGSGMDPKTENNPYLGFIYTSFQERATFVSHGATARLARSAGDSVLAKMCGTIAADERRHETAYKKIIGKCFDLDSNGAILAFGDMMQKQITMPAHYMFDGESETLFKEFSEVAQRVGVYTARDYADIVEHLVKFWKVAERSGLSPEAEAMQDYLCRLPARVSALGDRLAAKAKKKPGRQSARFSWVFNREVPLR